MSRVIYSTENFRNLNKNIISDEVYQELVKAVSDPTSNVRYDSRCSLYDYNTVVDATWEWYYNYLDTQYELSQLYPDSYPCKLLDMGYIPLVFIPSTVKSELARTMTLYLDLQRIPYIPLQALSFSNERLFYNVKDAWISKLDVIEYYKGLQEQGFAVTVPTLMNIRSSDLARLLFNHNTISLG